MRIKELFTVPEGEKVTEKVFSRVLISSVCSILLSMACLFGTTWAWFAVSIENKGNVIEIAKVEPEVVVTTESNTITPADDGSYTLGAGTYSIQVKLKPSDEAADDGNLLNDAKSPVYVTMAVNHGNDVQYRVFAFDSRASGTTHTVTAKVGDGTAVIRFSISWVQPADVPVGNGTITVGTLSAGE